ncbi:CoA-binding protein [Lipomyces arxii]|uniref:CoA-binding protein n=1 Tax=Lipomyces arxii TaxID=56418 RepID=UPI0034CD9803
MAAESVRQFFTARSFAVAGASTDTAKYGNKVLKWYYDHDLSATGVNPNEPVVYAVKCSPSITTLIESTHLDSISVSVVTSPRVSQLLLEELNRLGPGVVKGVWFQPGSYDNATLAAASKDLNIIAGGRCILLEGEQGLHASEKL